MSKNSPKAASAKSDATINVTYVPLNAGDPHETHTGGHGFKANVAKPLHPVRHKVLIDLLKGNPSFKVEGFPQAKYRAPTAEPIPAPGIDSDTGTIQPGGKVKELEVDDRGGVHEPEDQPREAYEEDPD